LARESQRIDTTIDAVRTVPASNPKARRLVREVEHTKPQKTIVFTNAISTAMELAKRLAWERVAVVTGRGARIASGPLPTDIALELFAPEARGAPRGPERADVRTLIATDLVSEGLNLQDASHVVHYDVPWTPLRLQQRVGRVARLGSRHQAISVSWFLPAPALERRLQFSRRIDAKLAHQRTLGVPVSSRVGASTVLGRTLERRERLAAATVEEPTPGHAVVSGPRAAVFVLEWDVDGQTVPDILVFEGRSPRLITDLERAYTLIERLSHASASAEPLCDDWHRALVSVLRRHLGALHRGPTDGKTRRLRRTIMDRAAAAGRARRRSLVDTLDRVLGVLVRGVPEGAVREMEDTLFRCTEPTALTRWARRWDTHRNKPHRVALRVALIGDGAADS
jgi:hypothetical protein